MLRMFLAVLLLFVACASNAFALDWEKTLGLLKEGSSEDYPNLIWSEGYPERVKIFSLYTGVTADDEADIVKRLIEPLDNYGKILNGRKYLPVPIETDKIPEKLRISLLPIAMGFYLEEKEIMDAEKIKTLKEQVKSGNIDPKRKRLAGVNREIKEHVTEDCTFYFRNTSRKLREKSYLIGFNVFGNCPVERLKEEAYKVKDYVINYKTGQ